MDISNPRDLVGKDVVDANGKTIGTIDKAWNSWNRINPGYFFGVRPNEFTRFEYFRGTNKLVPIYSQYIRQVGSNVMLYKTVEELGWYWKKAFNFGNYAYPTDDLIEKPMYDRNSSRIGTFYGWFESDGTFKNYGCFLDPYLTYTWNMPNNTLMPIPVNSIYKVTDTIILDKTLNELREYWRSYFTQQQRY